MAEIRRRFLQSDNAKYRRRCRKDSTDARSGRAKSYSASPADSGKTGACQLGERGRKNVWIGNDNGKRDEMQTRAVESRNRTRLHGQGELQALSATGEGSVGPWRRTQNAQEPREKACGLR